MDFHIPLVLFSHEILKRCNHVIIIISFYIFLQMIKNIMSTKSYDQFGLNNYISLVVVLFIIVIILKLNASLVYLQR